MKHLIYFFILVFWGISYGQGSSNRVTPFQVVYSVNCVDKLGDEIKNFDLLSIDETIHVRGEITILHEVGLPIFFIGDTTIQLRLLHETISPPSIQKKKKKGETEITFFRPLLEKLLLTDGKQAISPASMCLDCYQDIRFICPFKANNRIYLSGDLNIKWEQLRVNDFQIKIETMFSEEVVAFNTKDNELFVDSLTINGLLDSQVGLFLTIGSAKKSGFAVIKKYPFKGKTLCDCNSKSPAYILLLGFFAEMTKNPFRDVAESYYIKAAQLSGDEFFKTMLNNFYERKKFYK